MSLDDLSMCCVDDLLMCLQAFPLQFTTVRVHKPSSFERFWFRNLLFAVGSIVTARTLIKWWKDGTILKASSLIHSKINDHVVHPVLQLGSELFDTIRKRENVVTREDLEESRYQVNCHIVSDYDS